MKKFLSSILVVVFLVGVVAWFITDDNSADYIEEEFGVDVSFLKGETKDEGSQSLNSNTDLTDYEIPEYNGEEVVIVNDNIPYFNEEDLDLSQGSWETFADYDSLGRVGVADALLHNNLMPTQDREDSGSISHIYPTGFKHDNESNNRRVDGGWLYHRSHLIGFQLTGHMNNEHNLMTGTKTFNTPNMVSFENEVANYLEDTDNHVRYRITPSFKDDELVARGIFMEAKSVEDDSIEFNVFIHNVEDGVNINYLTGESEDI